MEATLRQETTNALTPWEENQVQMVKSWFETAADMELDMFEETFCNVIPLITKRQVVLVSTNLKSSHRLEEKIEIHGFYSYRVICALTDTINFQGYEMSASFTKGSEYAYCIKFTRDMLQVVSSN